MIAPRSNSSLCKLVDGKLVNAVGNRVLVNDAETSSETELSPALGLVTRLEWYKELETVYLLITTTSGLLLASLRKSELCPLIAFEHRPVSTQFLGPPLAGIYIEFELASYIWGIGHSNASYSAVYSPPQLVHTNAGPQWAILHRQRSQDSSRISLWPCNDVFVVMDAFDIDTFKFSPCELVFAYTDKYTFDLRTACFQTQELAVQNNIAPVMYEWTATNLLIVLHEDKHRYEALYEKTFDSNYKENEMKYRTESEYSESDKVLILTAFDKNLIGIQCLSGIVAFSYYEMSVEYTLVPVEEQALVASSLISFELSKTGTQMLTLNERFVCLWELGASVELGYAVRIDAVTDSLKVEFNRDGCLEIRWPKHKLLMPSTGPVLHTVT